MHRVIMSGLVALSALGATGPALGQPCVPGLVGQFGEGTDGRVLVQTVYDPDGPGPLPAQLVVAGDFTHAGGIAANRIASWDGARWSALGGGVPLADPNVQAMAAAPGDGPLYVGGAVGGVGPAFVASWDGAAWSVLPPMPANPNASGDSGGIFAMALYDDDGAGPHAAQVYVAQSYLALGFTTWYHRLLRWDGAGWTVLDAVELGRGVAAVAIEDGGAALNGVYIVGFYSDHSNMGFTVRRWDGTGFASITGADQYMFTYHTISSLAEFRTPGGQPALFAAGSMGSIGGVTVTNAAYWDGAVWSAAGAELGAGVNALGVHDADGAGPGAPVLEALLPLGVSTWNGVGWSDPAVVAPPPAYGLETLTSIPTGTGLPALVVGGTFPVAGNVWTTNLARSLGGGWAPVGQSPNNSVHALLGVRGAAVPDGLYAGGAFTTVGGTESSSLARWNGAAWAGIGAANNHVDALALGTFGGQSSLYAAGKFTSIGGVGASHIGRWDGAAWSGLGAGMNDNVSAVAFSTEVGGAALYVGGDFTSAGGQAAAHVAKWSGAGWSALGAGMDGPVRALVVFNSGAGAAVYAGGEFAAAGGQGAAHIARWNGAGWSALGAGVNGTVRALAVFDDGTGPALYAGGEFTSAGGQPAPGVARWNGAAWSSVGAGLNGSVLALGVVDSDGPGPARPVLYAGGAFTASGAVSCPRAARWDGAGWSALDGGADDNVLALSGFDADGTGPGQNDVYLGGDFFKFGGVSSSHLARWASCACYANCDGSTTPPVLNVGDFVCFLNRFAAGDPAANCDGSTVPPVLNVGDFTCFLNAFAAGCP